ncbi:MULTISPECIES: glycosyltransferase family A protein [unclassified Rhodococcus (in: high G+C Gram-positive bacteria)]|uniref:glycosyltransferase family 2 protein n=1 Tax=unclassified Rhodococcus (in: high G+C Gram-positive bacteria) TaxID=192944 RepID=UPI00277B520A|nr:glycosyltransferase family A protein [Rhodococcus sp. 1163]
MHANQLSVIVPEYNEENYITACLEALLEQGEDVAEILVVNNNSTDSSVSIVKSFVRDSAKVVLPDEFKRGVAFARNAGFDAASHDILGRVDADSRVCPGWARTVIDYFDRGHRADRRRDRPQQFVRLPFPLTERLVRRKADFSWRIRW